MDGDFIITGIAPGYIKLRVSFISFRLKLSEDILIRSNNVPYIEIKLEENQQSMELYDWRRLQTLYEKRFTKLCVE